MTDKTELPKTFDPAAIEAKWYPHWEGTNAFRPERPGAEPYTIVNPPPNVTGSLHIGHALDNTLQDIMIRYERLRGKDALWVVGTDHAGIATQMVVERQLEAKQDKRTNYSREDFVQKVWEWKEESGGAITRQLRRLGCSMDWSREQFTMDPHFSKAVLKVFVDLYNQGLIYRDKRLVNWDPKLKTAISDLEVETREVQGHFWHFRYPLADGVTLDDGRDHIVVATTRPETMLADMAVAVNGADPRYQSVIGKFVELPITGRRIRIVADDHADPELGSGAVKITPGHDFNDFEVGRRAGIAASDMLNMFDAEARVVQTADGLIPAEFIGVDRFDARKLVVERMKALGRLVPHVVTAKDGEVTEHDAEPRTIQTPYGDRGGVVIEPWLTDQWYVDAKTLAQPAIEAVKTGVIEIVPKSWEKTYFHWMDNIQPWCVSRQLWWGHRIPAWEGPPVEWLDFSKAVNERGHDPKAPLPMFVAETEDEAIEQARAFYTANGRLEGKALSVIADGEAGLNQDHDQVTVRLRRDPDVLDTWFSSALWPFATLGWPDAAPAPFVPSEVEGRGETVVQGPSTALGTNGEGAPGTSLLAKHYPNDLLISGFDILFFWDARMAMMGTHFMGQAPWKRLYLHGLVRAADGAKMSKSKGNTVDPLGLIDSYGADALRFFMAAMESQGRDIKMDERRVEGYRNFATKLWNASRFCQANGIGASSSVAAPAATLAVNRWIIGEVVETVAALDKALADLRFDAAANAIYHFVWDQFCDWYLELIKPVLSAESDAGEPSETRAVAGWVLDQILVMLHPFMPFITEELWHALGERSGDLIVAQWPAPQAEVNAAAKAEIEWVVKLVSDIRSARVEVNVKPSEKLLLGVANSNPANDALIERNRDVVMRLGRLSMFTWDAVPVEGSLVISHAEATYLLPVADFIDIAAEKARLSKALEAVSKEAKSLEGRLSNPAFVEKAKPEAVEKARADHADKSAEAERLAAALARLG
ncbi:valine--tRNA ligase [Sphingomonas ursincola]|uniref:valine--tRNA ligase n=1 Tax=Sphingomonas ursincola TaxID=56361 RepID=UPI0023555408|nr:valine--tRNA ligase [Sphingomonas ursincola]MBY0618905.1 valine--tRNA ligase [Sphingomonas ursincola]